MIYFSNVSISPRRTNEMTSFEFRVSAKRTFGETKMTNEISLCLYGVAEAYISMMKRRRTSKMKQSYKFGDHDPTTSIRWSRSYNLTSIRRSDPTISIRWSDLDPTIRPQSDDPMTCTNWKAATWRLFSARGDFFLLAVTFFCSRRLFSAHSEPPSRLSAFRCRLSALKEGPLVSSRFVSPHLKSAIFCHLMSAIFSSKFSQRHSDSWCRLRHG